MNMGLKEFISIYDVFCKDDFDIIIKWAGYNGCQSQLISLISALASSMVEDKKALEWQVKEWSAYAMNLVPTLYADTDFTTCINALRLAYFAYDGEQYIQIVDNIMQCDCMTWAVVEEMHPMIGLKYRGIKESI
jgi:hypothetical protein